MATVNLIPLGEFNPDADIGSSISKRWETWIGELKMYLVASGITRKRALLLYLAGRRVREIFANVTGTGEDDNFDTAITKLTEYFTPLKNRRYEVYRFRQLTQGDNESLDAFHMRLRAASSNCEFTNVDFEIEQQIITGGKSTQIRRKALADMLVDGRGK